MRLDAMKNHAASSTTAALLGVKQQTSPSITRGKGKDAFKSSGPLEIARHFKKNALDLFTDWKTTLPRDGEDGAKYLDSLLKPYTEHVKGLKEPDAQYFVKLCFGKDTLQALEEGSLINSSVKNFKEVIESTAGTTVKDLIKAYK